MGDVSLLQFDAWRTPALKRLEILRTESMDSEDGVALCSTALGLSCSSLEENAEAAASFVPQTSRRQPGWESLKARTRLQVDVHCTSTPGCNLEELIRQLEEPLSPTLGLTDMDGTGRADLFGETSSFPEGPQSSMTGCPQLPTDDSGFAWNRQFGHAQLDERSQSMPLLGLPFESGCFFHPAASMPLPEVIGWPEPQCLSESCRGQGDGTKLPGGFEAAQCQQMPQDDALCGPGDRLGAGRGQHGADGMDCLAAVGGEQGANDLPHRCDTGEAAGTLPNAKPPGEASKRCLRCGTTTTPQWRVGPTGPRSLCNACGVKYKKELRDRGEVSHACPKRRRRNEE